MIANNPRKKLMEESVLNNYELSFFLGKGEFGHVHNVVEKATGKVFAAKISKFKIDDYPDQFKINLFREVNIISKLNHPSILQFINYSPINFDKEPKPVIITEYLSNGSLERVIDLERRGFSLDCWDDTKKLIIIYGIASGMQYLHSHDIIHRDLKPANILLDDVLFPKIADFGLSKINRADQGDIALQSGEVIKGTFLYIAPEVFKSFQYTKACDVYAFAYILYEIITNIAPFKGYNPTQILTKAIHEKERPNFLFPIPDSYQKLIESCWADDPNERPTFDEIVHTLKTDPGFITEKIQQEDFLDYVEFIDSYHSSFDSNKHIKVCDFLESHKSSSFQKVEIQKIEANSINKSQKISQNAEDIFKQSSPDGKNIKINSSDIETLYSEGTLSTEDFLTKLKGYLAISIEIIYPTNNFESIFNIINRIKKQNFPSMKVTIIFTGLKKINSKFEKSDIINCVVIRSDVEEIGDKAFNGCNSLEEIVIPDSVTSIGFQAFNCCSSLKNFNLPDDIDTIDEYAFSECNSLTEVTIPGSVEELEEGLFMNCKLLQKVTIPDTVDTFGDQVFFNCESLTEVNIPSSLTEISDSAFSGCSALKSIKIPDSVASIKKEAFFSCESLREVVIPNSVTEIDDSAFSNCLSLRKLTISNSVTSIGEEAFWGCENLKEIYVPSSIESIGEDAFKFCLKLKKISIPSAFGSIDNLGIDEDTKIIRY